MDPDPNGPADTTMMRIVHDALRRDLRRVRQVITGDPPPDRSQRVAVAAHLRWVMGFLEAHHRAEDLGLYPLRVERDPAADALVADMAAEHAGVAEAIPTLEAAATDYAQGGAVGRLVAALDDLGEALLPHLRREEDEAMPAVSRAITDAEWSALEQRYNLEGKSMAQLAQEGHWLIDGATAEDRGRVLGLVPPVPRFVLVHGFGPAHRRRTNRWRSPRRRVQRRGAPSVVVDADIESVWAVVRDPTRVGEWSHECVAAQWIGGADEARPGARFRGRNAQGLVRWGRVCEILRADPHELVFRTVPTRTYPDSTVWSLRLTTHGQGTTIEQRFEVVKGSKLEWLYVTLLPAHRDRSAALERDLRRLGEVAGATTSPLPAA